MCSATSHLGGKMTKSSNATPGLSVGAVNTMHIKSRNVRYEKDQRKKIKIKEKESKEPNNAYQCLLKDHYDQTEQYYKGRICLDHTANGKSFQIRMHPTN